MRRKIAEPRIAALIKILFAMSLRGAPSHERGMRCSWQPQLYRHVMRQQSLESSATRREIFQLISASLCLSACELRHENSRNIFNILLTPVLWPVSGGTKGEKFNKVQSKSVRLLTLKQRLTNFLHSGRASFIPNALPRVMKKGFIRIDFYAARSV